MTLFNEKYRIETTRLPGWDYRAAGCYFVTICTQARVETLGTIANAEMHLSDAGEIAAQCWAEIPAHHTGVSIDDFVVMPDHVHGIIVLDGTVETLHAGLSHAVLTRCNVSTNNVSTTKSPKMSAISPKTGSLGAVVRSYKSAVTYLTHRIGRSFEWQARYWEHIIRNDAEFESIRQYILQNPEKWELDHENDSGPWM